MTSPIDELKQSKDHLFSLFSRGEITETFQGDYTEIMDHYFRRSLQENAAGESLFAKKHPFALVALGGYGRKELCYHSDIDIMVLFKNGIPSEAADLAEKMFFPLWDIGLELGHATRNIRDCLTLSKQDFQVFTSLLDARFIGGDSPLYLNLVETFQKKLICKKPGNFWQWLKEMTESRTEVFGDASYLLEPNLKEGIGGLRDYHHILWLARVFFNARVPRDLEYLGLLTHAEYLGLEKQLRMIWLTRNHLHSLAGRKNDRLIFEYQDRIALHLGYRNKPGFPAVEQFLGDLHAAMAAVKSLYRSFVITHLPETKQPRKPEADTLSDSPDFRIEHGQIGFKTATDILSRPVLLMNIFEKSSQFGIPLSLESKRLVKEFLYLADDAFRSSKEVVRIFLDIINHPRAFDILDQMFETGLLETFVPEYKGIKDRIQFDTYHVFPIGRHALKTLQYLKTLSLEKDFLFVDILADLPNPEPLFLAALFHDIGKRGKDHALRGAAITAQILKRFYYDRDLQKDVLFLIHHHLLLAETATRRDLNDEKSVVQCARAIGDIHRLKMLYLLTWADSMATGPKAWNEWTANLVRELFFKVLHILEKGKLATPLAQKKVKEKLSRVRRLVGEMNHPHHDLDRLFEAMAPRYLLETPVQAIVRHLEILQDLGASFNNPENTNFCLQTNKNQAEGSWEITLMAKDRPGLFSDIAGILALNNINILSAYIYTWRDGTAVDIFRVTDPLDLIHPEDIWKRVEKDMAGIFAGDFDLPERLANKTRSSILGRQKPHSRAPKARFDNDSSDFFTIVEVFADDRVGLLYDITQTLFRNDINITIAKISTKADQIADIFYVHDLEGQKIEGKDRMESIKKNLLRVIQTHPAH